ncbi:MAG TPA: PEP-CTERM sorting domain-containing protein [Terriglobia bacterium]|nr:PEP-CTERM sorting domain-containing protein [Terriglobia bacterium]
MKNKVFSLLSAAVLVLALGSMAKADSFTDTAGDVWSVSIAPDSGGDAGNVFDVTITVVTANTTAGTPYFLMGVSLVSAKTGGWGNNATAFAMDPTDTSLSTGPINPGAGACAGNVTESACWNINPGLELNGNTYSWTVDVTMASGTSFSAVHVQALGSPNQGGVVKGDGSHNLLSQDIDGSTPVPEPGSLALFGTGILGMAGFLRRKLLS